MDETGTQQAPNPSVPENDLVDFLKLKIFSPKRRPMVGVWIRMFNSGWASVEFTVIPLIRTAPNNKRPAAEFFNSATGPQHFFHQ